MKRNELKTKTTAVKNDTTSALQIVWDATNKGQRKKLLKDERIIKIFNRYNVDYTEGG